jgi:glutathione S-transferase
MGQMRRIFLSTSYGEAHLNTGTDFVDTYHGMQERLYGVLDARLADREYIAGPGRGSYSIVDINCFGWVNAAGICGLELERWPNVYAWWERIVARPAVQKGLAVPFPIMTYQSYQKERKEDPEGTAKKEGPLKEALEKAQKEYNYKYTSP